MATLSERIASKVLAAITKVGIPAVFTDAPAPNDYNVAAGETGGSPLPHNATVVPPFGYREGYIDHDLIRIGDAETMAAASGLGFTPTRNMTASIDSVDWSVMRVETLYGPGVDSSGNPQKVAYQMQLRRTG